MSLKMLGNPSVFFYIIYSGDLKRSLTKNLALVWRAVRLDLEKVEKYSTRVEKKD